uniref:ASCH domain-containing protein n=1 Tax=viral metagenome TaxID=1070528 RepID=A0A6M3IGL4_9ZZZZ
MKVPCISLWQPWAWWIMKRWKPLETRKHARFHWLEGKTIGIHAAKKWDKYAMKLALPYLDMDQIMDTHAYFEHREHGLLGTAEVKRFYQKLDDQQGSVALCPTGHWLSGLLLGSVKSFDKPIEIPGRQGVWYEEIAIPWEKGGETSCQLTETR